MQDALTILGSQLRRADPPVEGIGFTQSTSGIARLPKEALLNMMTYLNGASAAQLMVTCRAFVHIAIASPLWQRLGELHFLFKPPVLGAL